MAMRIESIKSSLKESRSKEYRVGNEAPSHSKNLSWTHLLSSSIAHNGRVNLPARYAAKPRAEAGQC